MAQTDVLQIPIDTSAVRRATADLLAFDRAGRTTDNGASRLTKTFAGLAIAATAIAGIKKTVTVFATFEKQLIGVGKTANLAGKELERFGDSITKLSTEIPSTTGELLEISKAAAQVGVKGSDNIRQFTTVIAKLGSASNLAGEEAATSLAKILTLTQENILEANRLASQIVSLGNNFATSEAQIARVAQRVAGATTNFNLGSGAVVALSASMSALGIEAEVAGSVMGRTFNALEAATTSSGESLRTLSQLTGIAGTEIEKAFAEDKVDVLQKFVEGLGVLSSTNATSALESLGLQGTEVNRVLKSLGSTAEETARAIALMKAEGDKPTALDREFAASMKALDTELQLLSNTFDAIVKKIGQFFAPYIAIASKAIRNFLNIFLEFEDIEAIQSFSKIENSIKNLRFEVEKTDKPLKRMVVNIFELTKAQKRQIDAQKQANRTLMRENEEIGKTAKQIRLLAIERAKETKITSEQEGAHKKYIATLSEQIELLKERDSLLTATEAAAQADEARQQALERYNDTLSTVEGHARTVFNSFFESGKSAFENLTRILKDTLIETLFQLTAKKWIVNIVSSITGGGGAGGVAGAAGSLLGGGGGLGGLGGIGNLISGGIDSFTGSGGLAGGFINSSLGSQLGLSESFGFNVGGGELFAPTSLGLGLGGALTGAGIGGLTASLTGGNSVGGSIGGAIGGVGAALAGVTGGLSLLAGAVGGAIGGLFDGGGDPEPQKFRALTSILPGGGVEFGEQTTSIDLINGQRPGVVAKGIAQQQFQALESLMEQTGLSFKNLSEPVLLFNANLLDATEQSLDNEFFHSVGELIKMGVFEGVDDGLASAVRSASGGPAIKQAIESWANARDTATAAIDTAAQMERLRSQFVANVNASIQQLTDPDGEALRALNQWRETAIAEAEALGAGTAEVEQLFSLQRQKIAEQAAAKAVAIEEERQRGLIAAASTAFSGLSQAVGKERSILSSAANDVRASLSATSSSLVTLDSALKSLRDVGATAPSLSQATDLLESALQFSQGGGNISNFEGFTDAVKTVSNIDESIFASALDFARARGQSASLIESLIAETENQLSLEEMTLEGVQSSLNRLDSILSESQEQVNLLNGINSSLRSVDNAFAALRSAVTSAGGSFNVPSFAVGTNVVPFDTPAVVHRGERIIPAADNAILMDRLSGSGDSELKAEVRQLREDMNSLMTAITLNTSKTKRVLENWDADGIPAERIPA